LDNVPWHSFFSLRVKTVIQAVKALKAIGAKATAKIHLVMSTNLASIARFAWTAIAPLSIKLVEGVKILSISRGHVEMDSRGISAFFAIAVSEKVAHQGGDYLLVRRTNPCVRLCMAGRQKARVHHRKS
jgi:hypothetical protein